MREQYSILFAFDSFNNVRLLCHARRFRKLQYASATSRFFSADVRTHFWHWEKMEWESLITPQSLCVQQSLFLFSLAVGRDIRNG